MKSENKMTMQQAEIEVKCYQKIFDSVRLLDVPALKKLKMERECNGKIPSIIDENWKIEHWCEGCVVLNAFIEKKELSRLEFAEDEIYQITARYLEIDGQPYVMELLKCLDKNSLINRKDKERLITSLTGYSELLYHDVLTQVYNRRYYEDEIKKKTGPAGIAMIDLDDFKLYNDTYGHNAGDMALSVAADVIGDNLRAGDILIRYGGDEFLVVMPSIGEKEFEERLQEIHNQVHIATVPGYSRLQLSVSIGGTMAVPEECVEDVVGRADSFMYQAKTKKDLVVTESNEIKERNAKGAEVDREDLKQQILIVDDSELNREILAEMLHSDFRTMEACSGEECLSMLHQYGTGISLVLLDIVMPGMDGFAVLEEMNRNHWLEDIPVIMISSEETESYIRKAYEMGVSDYISRPFDAKVVYRRVFNTIKLYVKQRRLITLVTNQIREKEKNSQILVDILSHIVEFRNGESGRHVQHIKTITGLLLEKLVLKTGRYHLQWSDQYLITVASALHDIGKIGIDEAILNKPGKLTKEEFEEMKKHTLIGASMLKSLGVYQDEEMVKVAYQICRWHHERYDGKGYPDRLKGEEIPIAAQVVSVADVYDALTSERVYKKAFTHEKAMEMILAGECGTFNPLLLECLKEIQNHLQEELKKDLDEKVYTQQLLGGKMLERL